MINFIIVTLVTLTFLSNPLLVSASENWKYNNEDGYIYTVFKTTDATNWTSYIVAKINNKTILIEALVPLSEYKKHFTLNLPTKLTYNGISLVKHDTFFWGEDNSTVTLQIDNNQIDGFIKKNSYQIVYEGNEINNMISKLKTGNRLKINKHFWDNNNKKAYPVFSLTGFTNVLSQLKDSEEGGIVENDYPESGLHCKNRNTRKIVWINTSHGSYALNGQAISWVNSVKKSGSPLLGSDGKPMKLGRDHIQSQQLSSLIDKGLKLCK